MEQFPQESDEEIHGWDNTTGRVVSKVIAFLLLDSGHRASHELLFRKLAGLSKEFSHCSRITSDAESSNSLLARI